MTLAAPDDAIGIVVKHDRHVLVPLLVADLVDSDADKAIEAVACGSVEAVVDALANGAHAFPVDAHELGNYASVAMYTQPCDLFLEGVREARCVVRPRNRSCDYAMFCASDTKRAVFEISHRGAKVECAPTARMRRAVVDRGFAVAMRATAALALTRRNADYQLAVF